MEFQRHTIPSRLGGCLVLAAAAAILAVAAAVPVRAQTNATWVGGSSNDYNANANWNPATVPTGTAIFGVSGQTSLTFSQASTSVGGWLFNVGASNYSFLIGAGQTLNFGTAGIVVNGGSATITNDGSLFFAGNSTAGNAAIINGVGATTSFVSGPASVGSLAGGVLCHLAARR